ncbi:uncharacterized protein [Triticum aestivum]|uniref:uncharacterized protein n=1 Tax=Triticum aestivum TaxID=4565 RepID=UPI001D01F719|nr:uncharacterized protein LOC123107214 [Triticum aestivum]
MAPTEVLEVSPGSPTISQEHVDPPLIEIAAEKSPELPEEIMMDIFALFVVPEFVRALSTPSGTRCIQEYITSVHRHHASSTLQNQLLQLHFETTGSNHVRKTVPQCMQTSKNAYGVKMEKKGQIQPYCASYYECDNIIGHCKGTPQERHY